MDLRNRILEHLAPDLPCRSRIHPLIGYLPVSETAPVFIKREDELNPAAIGGKLRKYLSLLPYIERNGYQELILIGSAHSNNLLGLSHFLRSCGLRVHLVVKQPGNPALTGNWLFLNMLLEKGSIHPLHPREWPGALEYAGQLAVARSRAGYPVLIVPEGGEHPSVLPGLLTLALDIADQQTGLSLRFGDIWTDSGTGISAIGLLLGMRLLGMNDCRVHVTLIAGSETEFMQRYQRFEEWAAGWLGEAVPTDTPELIFHTPASAAAYGSINRTIRNETLTIARETGILMDPVYSVKHFYTLRREMARQAPQGPQLVLYNGGPLGLCGFQTMLARDLQS